MFLSSDDLLDRRIPDKLDLLVSKRLLLHNLRRAQFVAAMDHVNFGGVAREKSRLFHCRVTAADYDQRFVAKMRQWSVASRAGGYAVAAKTVRNFRLSRNSEPLRRGARRDDQGFSRDGWAAVDIDLKRPLAQIHFSDPAFHKFCPETFGLLAKLVHKLGTLNAFGKAGVIFDVSGDHQLAARRSLLSGVCGSIDQQWFQACARRVNCCREAGWSRSDDDDVSFGRLIIHLSAREYSLFG